VSTDTATVTVGAGDGGGEVGTAGDQCPGGEICVSGHRQVESEPPGSRCATDSRRGAAGSLVLRAHSPRSSAYGILRDGVTRACGIRTMGAMRRVAVLLAVVVLGCGAKARDPDLIDDAEARRRYLKRGEDPNELPPEHQPKWKPGERPGDYQPVQPPPPAPTPIAPAPIAPAPAAPAQNPRTTGSTKLLLFGGQNRRTFLGCLCSEYDTDSVFNKYGTYGNQYSSESIWNKYSDYGSRYSDMSVCNKYATNPPIVVTADGQFVGYLTLDRYKAGALTDQAVMMWLEKMVCEQ
jgi:hypothetical protein